MEASCKSSARKDGRRACKECREKKGRGSAARAEISAPAPHPGWPHGDIQGQPDPLPLDAQQTETKSKRKSRVVGPAICADTAEKEPTKVSAAEKKASTARVKSRKSIEERQVVPSSKPDPHGSQAGPNAISTAAPISVSPKDVEDISSGSQDAQPFPDFHGESNVQCFSAFHRESNAFSMNPSAGRSVHFSN